MKNYEVEKMLVAAKEVAKLKSKDLDFIMPFLKIKKSLEAKMQELQDIMKAIVDFTEAEQEILQKIHKGEEYDVNSKTAKSLEEKNKIFFQKQTELLNKDSELNLEKIPKDKFPDGCSIEHFEAFYDLLT